MTRSLSNNPKSVKSREWYRRHRSDSTLKSKVKENYVSIRDTNHFRNSRAEIMARYRRDPVQGRKMAALNQQWAENNSEKVEAYKHVHNALRRGDIVRPESCTRCGSNPGRARDGRSLLHGHHADYSKPLEVEWLCSVCHGAERRTT